MEEILQLLHKL